MPTNYPNALDTTEELKNDADNQTISSLTHPKAHNNVSDALLAIETELGVNPSGDFHDVITRIRNILEKSPAFHQVISSHKPAIVPLNLKVGANQSTALVVDIQNTSGSTIGYWDRTGKLSGSELKINDVLLASTHLSDSNDILRNPSPSITTPTISSATLTGTPVSTTPPVDNNSTRIATTAYVKNQGYITPNSPNLTGTPTAPTPPVGDEDTSIATTAFVIAEINNRATPGIPVGMISPYGASSPPTGWLVCDGAAVSRTTYSQLFNVIGTTYGAGDGSTTFNLPDLRGRIPVSIGSHADVDALNDNDGVAAASRRPKHSHSHSLSLQTAGGHSHTVGDTNSAGGHSHTGDTSGSTSVASGSVFFTAQSASVTTSEAGGHSHSGDLLGAGGHSHTISGTIGVSGMTDGPAYIVTQYIIRATT